ncbi:MAG: PhzF family phenazine biosynthesis protein [Fuerstiella sp.]
MSLPFFQIDSFTSEAFSGNPAAVILLDKQRSNEWLQLVAMENNLSETAFVLPSTNAQTWPLRWFTPTIEVDLCGHATLAAAHALWESETVPCDQPILFETRSGPLTVKKLGNHIQMDFPITPVTKTAAPKGLIESLQINGQRPSITEVLKSAFDYMVVVHDEATVRNLTVDFRQLAQVDARGAIVTAIADPTSDYDFVSRFFGPAAGVDEDPVTGSAHCALIDYFSQKRKRNQLTGYQASARGGIVEVEKRDDRAILSGEAVTVIRGQLFTPPRPDFAA